MSSRTLEHVARGRALALGLVLVVSAAPAQQPLEGAQMQQMMQLQACLERVDGAALQDLEARSAKAQEEVRALCAAGAREAAEQRALAFGREVAASRETQVVAACGEMARQMFAAMPPNARATQDPPFETGHVCDSEE